MAAAPYSFPYSSVVTYPPPIFPSGYYYPSPYPYASPPAHGFFPAPSPPPAFPPSPPPTYPYPPPASAYAPPSSYFPTPAFPYAAAYPHPPDLCSTSYTPSEPTSPTTARAYSTAPTALTFPYSQVHAPPSESTVPPTPGLTPTSAQSWVASSQSSGLDSVRVFQPLYTEMTTTAPVRRPERVSSSTPPWLLDTVRSPPNRERTPLQNPLAMELYADEGLQTPEKSCALRPGKKGDGKSGSVLPPATPDFMCQGGDLTKGTNTHITSINGEKLVHKQPGPEILSMGHAGYTHHFVPATSPILDVAKSNGYKNHWYGHPNPIQSSCVQGGSNLSEQSLDGMPQSYGLHNLNRQSVFLGDGSEHSYFVLPEKYPLQRAVPEPVFDVYEDGTEGCSSKSVDVFVGTPGQQIYEEEQQGEQLLKCLSKALETKHTSACLNTTSDVWDFTLELQQQDARRAFSCSVLKVYDSLVTRSTQLGIEHSMRQLRLQWNPGVHSIPYSTTNIDTVGFLQSSILPRSGVSIHTDLLLAGFQFGVSRCCVPRQCYGRLKTRLINHRIHFLWDPGILSLMGMMLGKNAVTNLVYRSETSIKLVFFIDQPVDMKHFLFQLLLQYHWWCHTLNAFPKLQYCHLPILWYCPYTSMFSSTKAIHFALSMSTARTVRMILVLSFERSAHEERDEAVVYKVLILQLPWDTGVQNIISMMLDKYTLPRQVQFVQQTSELLFLSLRACIQYVAPKSTNSVRHATCFILGRDVHLTQFNYLSSLYCKSALKTSYVWDPGVKTSLHNWLGILTVRSATDKPLSCTHIPDLAAGQNQSGGSGTCYIWDPGTVMGYTFVWLVLATVRDTLYAKHYSQTVQTNYSAKNLLSSPNNLQILEMDILFITFLPP